MEVSPLCNYWAEPKNWIIKAWNDKQIKSLMAFAQSIVNQYKAAYDSEYTWILVIEGRKFIFDRNVLENSGDFHCYQLPKGWLCVIVRSIGMDRGTS